jgi:two-component system chemotaxis sensor kinase CheA
MNELQRQFFAEAEELLESLFRALQQLRLRRSEGRMRRDLTGQIFRYVHTLKGAAGAAEMEQVRNLAHEFESALDSVRIGRVPLSDPLLDTFEDAAYAISENLVVADGRKPAQTGDLLQRLRDFAASGSEEKLPYLLDARSLLPGDIAAALSRYDERHLGEVVAEGARLFIISASFPLAVFDDEFRALSARLAKDGEILATVPGAQLVGSGAITFRLLYAASGVSADVLRENIDQSEVTVTELVRRQDMPVTSTTVPSSDSGARVASSTPVADTVRVSLAELDDLIARASELFRETVNTFESRSGENEDDANAAIKTTQTTRIREQFVELENRLIKLRMVPLAATFERAARAGRLAARATGKEVIIEITGGEVPIDKSLAATIAGPLIHLVRNAVDHGIEFSETRIAAGKSGVGRIQLSAASESNRIEIFVTDDGRGIEPARVGRAAAEREIIADASSVTFDQCLRLIFRPGFSTADAVSETSGRGIGLEIVDRAMADAGGEVRVRTDPGNGTTFQMILPATLALVATLLVRAENNFYHIDARCVVDQGSLDESGSDSSRADFEWRGKVVPRIELKDLLGLTNGQSPDLETPQTKSFLVVRNPAAPDRPQANDSTIATAEHTALIVDSIEGEHQALVRSLGRHAARWRGIAGANELRDGSVALVLDLGKLLELSYDAGTGS